MMSLPLMLETLKAQANLLVIVAPGQGAQTPAMFEPWIEHLAFQSVLQEASESTGIDLQYLGTRADAEEIRETKNAQPLLVTSALASYNAISENLDLPSSTLVAGHSVGEVAALAISGTLSYRDAFRLVSARANAMQEAAEQSDTSMAAVLGGDRETVLSHLRTLNLVAANENGAGQIVAAGSSANIATLLEQPPSGARVRALSVAGAFHTDFMKPAQGSVQSIAQTLQVSDPEFRVLSNKEGAIIASGKELVERIITQIANPVRWDLCMETMQHEGVTGLLELFPGGTLTAIAKRAMNNIETFAISSPDSLTDAVEFAQRHSSGEQ